LQRPLGKKTMEAVILKVAGFFAAAASRLSSNPSKIRFMEIILRLRFVQLISCVTSNRSQKLIAFGQVWCLEAYGLDSNCLNWPTTERPGALWRTGRGTTVAGRVEL
jgi:hypothetical protein